jgi:HEPN domain-containing protein
VSSPKHDLRDVAARFARKARSDEITLDKLADDPDVPDDVIGFHTQQAIEKLLKAALACAGVAPPRIHDLGELIALLGDANLSPPASAREARALVPWAVEFRYDDILDERLDRAAAREAVARLRAWLDGLLPPTEVLPTDEPPPTFPANAPNMVAAVARPGYVVRVMFADGEIRDVDITPLLDTEVFAPLRDAALFARVSLDEGLGTITWPNGADLDPDVIYATLDRGPHKARIRKVASGDLV